MTSICKKLIAGLAVLVISIGGFVAASSYRTYQTARTRLDEIKQLSISSNPTTQFAALRHKYENELHLTGCTRQGCQYELELSNKSAAAFRIAPYTELNIRFTTHEGSLQWAMLEYRTALRGRISPVLHVQEGMCSHGCGVRFDVNPHGTSKDMWNGLVEFDFRASVEERDAALALDLRCFLRVGGCKDIVDLLPTMWRRTRADEISSQLVGLSQRLEESHSFPPADDF